MINEHIAVKDNHETPISGRHEDQFSGVNYGV